MFGFEIHFVSGLRDVHEEVSVFGAQSVRFQNQIHQVVVFDGDVPILARFPGEGEHHVVATFGFFTLDVLDVHGFEGRQPVGFVGAGVFIGTDPNVVQIHQPDHEGCHGVKAHVARVNIASHLSAQARQLRSKIRHVVVLHLRRDLRPIGMVAVLQPPLHVSPRRLDVAAWIGANPDILPRGR